MQEASLEYSESKAKSWLSIYLELSKARLSFLVVVTTVVGFLFAADSTTSLFILLYTITGTALSAAGANAFNQWYEAARDARMERTQLRPMPNGDLSSAHALLFAIFTSIVGVAVLYTWVNALTAWLALVNILIYGFIYTPLKTVSSFCTLVGAVCGAIPPLMGWAAVTGEIGYGAWILAAILFIWQIPHFLSLAWMYRDDYQRGGFKMLPLIDPQGNLTCRVTLLYCMALIAIGFAGTISGLTGWLYLITSTLAGSVFLRQAVRFYRLRSYENARALFLGSLLYLPLVLGFLVADKNLSHYSLQIQCQSVQVQQVEQQADLVAFQKRELIR